MNSGVYRCYHDFARTIGNGNKIFIMLCLLKKHVESSINANVDSRFHVKYSDIVCATGVNEKTVRRNLDSLETIGLISRETVTENGVKKVYFKINYDIIVKAKLEDDAASHLFISDHKEYLKKCPTIEKIRAGKSVE